MSARAKNFSPADRADHPRRDAHATSVRRDETLSHHAQKSAKSRANSMVVLHSQHIDELKDHPYNDICNTASYDFIDASDAIPGKNVEKRRRRGKDALHCALVIR
jgi:hypothetical protein